jgi:acetyltransferase-like isoleucine patch superfamily enzyme
MKNPFDHGFYSENDLKNIGFKKLGKNVLIDKTCAIFGLNNIEIGDNVRIDAYTSINASNNGMLRLGSYIHIGSYCLISARGGVELGDFSGLSQGVRIYSCNDDYSGDSLTNPMVPEKYTNVTIGKVEIGRHAILGSGCVVLPNVIIGCGCSVGALSLITRNLDEWGVYFGIPARRLKDRSKKLLEKEAALLKENAIGVQVMSSKL